MSHPKPGFPPSSAQIPELQPCKHPGSSCTAAEAPPKGDRFSSCQRHKESVHPAHDYFAGVFLVGLIFFFERESLHVSKPKEQEEARSFHSPQQYNCISFCRDKKWLQEMQNPTAGASGNFCLFPPTHHSQRIWAKRWQMMETHMSHPYISKRGATRRHSYPRLHVLQLHLTQAIRLWA